ncbi:MAG: flagellar biosynthesis anti-sigma factor FlgM [Proteobacteria bacterium]|nr:flagellar biosynthesis anti-sigma factor FlgM [Pseudomonadota bacterium]
MMTVIESNVMVNPLDESQSHKRIDKEKTTQVVPKATPEQPHSIQVNFSETSVRLSRLKEEILSVTSVNLERISSIKAAIENDSYQINSKNIVKKMIEDIELA